MYGLWITERLLLNHVHYTHHTASTTPPVLGTLHPRRHTSTYTSALLAPIPTHPQASISHRGTSPDDVTDLYAPLVTSDLQRYPT